ncbi:MAG: hypothetical protein ABFC98_07330 [Candidatus Cloacimonas sp.]
MAKYYESPYISGSNRLDDEPLAPPMKIGDWLLVLILICLPVVNIIMLIIWSLDKKGNPSRRTFAIAILILMAALIVLSGFYFGQMTGWYLKIINEL